MIENNSTIFSDTIGTDETVDDLKKRIKVENAPDLNDIDAARLSLWKVDLTKPQDIKPDDLTDENVLDPLWTISEYWDEVPEKCIHIYIRIAGK